MKKLLILLMMIYLLPAKADVLLDIINGKYEFSSNTSYESLEESDEQLGSGDNEPEHYSWDNLYPCHYCGIEVIVDPYAETSQDEILFDY